MKLGNHWNISSSAFTQNIWRFETHELVRLCQCVGSGTSGAMKQHVNGKYTFRVKKCENIPHDRWKEIYHNSVVCKVRPNKDNHNCTRITVTVNHVRYPGDVVTQTRYLELLKLTINSTLSRPGARFACFDIKNNNLDNTIYLS